MNSLFQNKTKNIVAICFSLIHLIALVLNGPFWGVTRLVIPIALLVLLFTANKEYHIKRWILPVAIALALVGNIRTLISQIYNIKNIIGIYGLQPLYTVLLISAVLTTIAGAVMFVGALIDFKSLFKYGTLSVAVLTLVSLVVDFLAVGGFDYIQSVPQGVAAVNFTALAVSLTQALFYIGIFILTTNKPISLEQKPE